VKKAEKRVKARKHFKEVSNVERKPKVRKVVKLVSNGDQFGNVNELRSQTRIVKYRFVGSGRAL